MAESPSFEAIDRLFQDVCDLAPDDRRAALEERALSEPELVEAVRDLLKAESEMGTRLDAAVEPTRGQTDVRPLPDRVGAYRIIRRIGDGGMGVVYEAEQDNPRRRVALKLIRPGLLTQDLLRRFEFESEILGRLKHPGIAQVIEAGTTEDGEPYFVMELVEGRPLSNHAASAALSTEQRLELFVLICDAVHHAHQKGVVHRDLKPANVLVTPEGVPKVLDFGVARVVGDEVRSVTMQTSPGQIVGTLAYMSPEQASSDSDAVDTRSDVYALGVVLYQLLSGTLPIEITKVTVFEALRRVKEQNPTRLGSVDPRFRGDLETIVAKAIEKDPLRRYAGVAELGADVRRFIRDEPIQARPTSTVYQLRMFAKRRRPLVLAIGVALLLLVGGVVVSSVLAVQRTIARDIARDERDGALRVNRFLTEDLLGAAMPENLGREVTVREAVDVAAASIGSEFQDRPLIQATIQDAIGMTYLALGEWAKARTFIEWSRETYLEVEGSKSERYLRADLSLAMMEAEQGGSIEAEQTMLRVIEQASGIPGTLAFEARRALAIMLRERGEYDAAEEMQRAMAAESEQRYGVGSVQAAQARSQLSATLSETDRIEDAVAEQQRAVETLIMGEGESDPTTISALAILGLLQLQTGDFKSSEASLTRSSRLAKEYLGPDHPVTVIYTANLGTLYSQAGQMDKAVPVLEEALAFADDVLGPDHRITMGSVSSLGVAYAQQGRHADAAPLLDRAADDMRRQLGETNPRTIIAKANAITTYVNAGEFDTAEPICRQAIIDASDALGPESDQVQVLLNTLAVIQFRSERYRDAERTWADVRAIVAKGVPSGHFRLNLIDASRGMALVRLGEYEAGEAVLVPAYEAIVGATGPTSYYATRFAIGMVELYEQTDRQAEADALRDRVPNDDPPSP